MSLPDHIRSAIHQYIPTLEGWTEPERACEMAELIIDMKPKTVVEIGTFGGRSAIAQAFALRENNNGGHIYAIDPWRLEHALEGEWVDNQNWYRKLNIHDIHRKCMEAIWGHNLEDWLVVIRAASQYVDHLFPKIHILLVDGNHSEVASLRDVSLYVPRVVEGGFVWFDDVQWEVKNGSSVIRSTQKALEYVESQCELIRQSGDTRLYRKR